MEEVRDLLRAITKREAGLTRYVDYYNGTQPIQFLGDKLQTDFGKKLEALSANRCQPVVDAVADRLQITGFADRQGGKDDQAANAIWQEHQLDLLADEVHQTALITGDAFVIVWPNADGTPSAYAQQTERIAVRYGDERPDEIEVGVKVWMTRSGHWRLNAYHANRLEKYVTKKEQRALPLHASQWLPHQDPADQAWPVPYTWDRVPIFHFAVGARKGQYGTSELRAIIPLQDRLNLTLANQAIAEEFQSYRQRWATGIQPLKDPETGKPINPFSAGADRVWMATSKDAQFGEFDAADLTMFETVAEGHELRIARTAAIPLYYLLQSGTPSGESLKTSEAPFVAKIKDRQRRFGPTWADLMAFMLALQGTATAKLTTLWQTPESRSDKEFWANAAAKREHGVSDQHILHEAGYSDDQVNQFAAERSVAEGDLGNALVRAFDAA